MTKWTPWLTSDCPHCGDDAEVLTDCTMKGMAYDGDKVRCVTCHCPGYVTVYDEDDVETAWHDEPDCDCEWCKTHLEENCKCGHC